MKRFQQDKGLLASGILDTDTTRALGLDPAKVVSAGTRERAVSFAGTWALNGVHIVLSESAPDAVAVEDGTVAFVQPYLGSNLGRPTSNYDLWQTDYLLTIENARRMTGESQGTVVGVGATGNVTTSRVTFVKCVDRPSPRSGISGLWVDGEIVNIVMDGANLRRAVLETGSARATAMTA